MPMLGDVFLNTVYADNPNRSVTATAHPIETGEDITDHISKNPITMSISGVLVGEDAAQRFNKLKEYLNKGKLLKYSNRTTLTDVIIENLSTVHDVEVKNGLKFDITLRQIRIAKASAVVGLKLPVKRQVAKVTKKGVQQKKTKSSTKKKAIQTKPKNTSTVTSGGARMLQ
ncbi:phage baseplate protein [Solibacillus sp. FSL W8-0474]|uniref:phage baseplate protein n=1 Tax=Solibacillus sp. FSL W8-0474 TaxID=2975336 RepID=UPI0030FB2A6E